MGKPRKPVEYFRPCTWGDARAIRSALTQDGWSSPDTYCSCFEPITDKSAVYLFLLHNRDDLARALVAYVGMSATLRSRLAKHNILPEIRRPNHWVMRWFKPTPRDALRVCESEYIKKFDPPWNISGRRRGLALQ